MVRSGVTRMRMTDVSKEKRATADRLETKVRQRARRGSIERAVIGTLLAGGLLTVGIMAPKVLSLIREEYIDAVVPRDPKQRLRETLWRLRRQGLVTFQERAGKKYPYLTKKGLQRAKRLSFEGYSIPKPLRWDGRWRIVIFDISHKRKRTRDRVRGILKRLGFFRLQNSVWVHPYNCEEIIALLKLDMRLRSEVLYLICDAIEYDRHVRRYFGLPME